VTYPFHYHPPRHRSLRHPTFAVKTPRRRTRPCGRRARRGFRGAPGEDLRAVLLHQADGNRHRPLHDALEDALEDALGDEATDALLSGAADDDDDAVVDGAPAPTVGTAARLVASGNVARAIAKACT
jgi:hypothetical protein